jgi:hypothetical protein
MSSHGSVSLAEAPTRDVTVLAALAYSRIGDIEAATGRGRVAFIRVRRRGILWAAGKRAKTVAARY